MLATKKWAKSNKNNLIPIISLWYRCIITSSSQIKNSGICNFVELTEEEGTNFPYLYYDSYYFFINFEKSPPIFSDNSKNKI